MSDMMSVEGLAARLRGRQFLLLTALDDLRNVHKAAERLNITQSAATKMLGEIENLLEATLFDRTNRGVQPTDVGLVVLRRARRIVTEIERMQEDARLEGQIRMVRVGAFSFAAAFLVPRTIERLAKDKPNLRVHFVEAPPRLVLEELRRGDLDVVVGRVPLGLAGIVVETVADQEVCVVANPAHPLAGRRRATWAQLAGGTWVLPPSGGAIRNALEMTLTRRDLPVPRVGVETTSLVATESCVENGMLALMPSEFARHLSRRGRLAILPLKLEVALPPISAAFEAGYRPGEATQAFMDALRKEAVRL